jgi:xanthine dehydrogenase YagR molybdenum-binding subunit
MATDNEDQPRHEKLVAGIASVALTEVERTVPADEAPPLPPNAELRLIGKSVPRWNGRQKVTGAVRFTADIQLPGMLHARLLRSPLPHARIRSLDTSAAARHPGVRAVLVLLGPNGASMSTSVSAEEGVEATRRNVPPIALYAGAAVAAVAAVSAQAADEAARLIKVDYEPLPFVVDMDDARAPAAPVVFETLDVQSGFGASGLVTAGLPLKGNVRGPAKDGRGDIAAGLAAAEVVVEGEYRTQVQSHCCLEPHGIVADWRADGLTVYISTQHTAGVREELARAFALPLSRVRVIVDAMGGGFGSKSTLGTYGRAAVALSRKAGAPVRLVLERHEEQIDTGYRPATWQHLRIGARRDGTLAAISLLSYGTAGTALGAGVGNIASRMYACPNFDESHYDVFINAGAGCAMRGPGNVPGAFALEQAIDELAGKLGLDPIALRDRIDLSPARHEERRVGAELIGWSRRHAAGVETTPVKTGLGMAQSFWIANVQVNATCEVRIMRDGSVEVRSSVQDIGTGIGTVLAQVVAEELGLNADDISVRIGDTEYPAGPPSHGSRTTASITPPARNAAHQACRKLFALAAPLLGTTVDDLAARDGRIVSLSNPARAMTFRDAAGHMRTEQIAVSASRADDYNGFHARSGDAAGALTDLGGVHFAAVTVDTETGLVRVERFVAVHDCGRPMNPKQIESQVHGGVLQGLGYALMEERILDRQTGHMVNANLEQYKLPGVHETPRIDVRVIENYQGYSSTDAYGMAEPASIATAPAIANAIYNAIGIRLRALPMNRAAILTALAAGRT